MAVQMFDVIYSITNKKKIYSREEVYASGLNMAILIKHLASHNAGVEVASYLNNNWKTDIYDMYLFAYGMMDSMFLKYIKRDKKLPITSQVAIVCEYYNISSTVAEKYLAEMTETQYNTIERIINESHGIYVKVKKSKTTKKESMDLF